jgi:hypothetical protein
MRRLAAVASGVAVFAACAAPAAAQDGAGLYEPFPEPAAPSVSRDFVEKLQQPGPRLASSLTPAQLDRGARVSQADLPAGEALPATAAAGPSGRAEPGAFLGSAAGWLGVAALLAAATIGTRRLAAA